MAFTSATTGLSVDARPKVSLTDTYSVATTCKSKLGQEAARGELQLRRLVGHANMLDMLMGELMNKERACEARLNEQIRSGPQPKQRRVQFIDTIVEEMGEDDDESDSDSDDYDDDVSDVSDDLFDDHEAFDYESDDEQLALHRVSSKMDLPELTDDDDSDVEEDSIDDLPSLMEQLSVNDKPSQHLATGVSIVVQ